MSPKALLKLRELLINRRREIFKQVAHLESESRGLVQREIERIDEAQKEDLTRMLDRLVKRGKEEIRDKSGARKNVNWDIWALRALRQIGSFETIGSVASDPSVSEMRPRVRRSSRPAKTS